MSKQLTDENLKSFRTAIYGNYRENGRVFSWRETKDPYKILVSEMMLQQTQTVRVIPKYDAWLQRFPDAAALAEASLADILSCWNGLGYNRRAVFLQKACQSVCSKYKGVFPELPEELEKLPGIGPYTARAVCTFAYNRPEVFIETNIRSVFIFFFYKDRTDKIPDSEILPLVEETLDHSNPRRWYYALMDYGAELKKKIINPSRKSSSYTKQSRFEGSVRQARGAVLRFLTKNGKAGLQEISVQEHIDFSKISDAAEKLSAENLICCNQDGIYTIK